VDGVVTFDDKPLPNALVSFHPVKSGPIPYGRTDDNGRYEIQTGGSVGLTPGEYLITIAANEAQENAPAPPAEGGEPPPVPLLTPERYANKGTSGLRATVRSGANKLDFNLHN
jgi:hypothetical protein